MTCPDADVAVLLPFPRALSRQTIPNSKMLFLARGGRLCEATRSAVEAAYSSEGGRRPFGFGGGDGVYRRFRYKGA
jgi:hypothetical protein